MEKGGSKDVEKGHNVSQNALTCGSTDELAIFKHKYSKLDPRTLQIPPVTYLRLKRKNTKEKVK